MANNKQDPNLTRQMRGWMHPLTNLPRTWVENPAKPLNSRAITRSLLQVDKQPWRCCQLRIIAENRRCAARYRSSQTFIGAFQFCFVLAVGPQSSQNHVVISCGFSPVSAVTLELKDRKLLPRPYEFALDVWDFVGNVETVSHHGLLPHEVFHTLHTHGRPIFDKIFLGVPGALDQWSFHRRVFGTLTSKFVWAFQPPRLFIWGSFPARRGGSLGCIV
jgi:hypothetical protein